ncbi:hypothetical protein LJR016_001876 [Devosia sp. LjRoot16]|uniref:hypothetical protein n=1 Tax=Hyphomicrobiales TaxID=356 RepID=UPI003ECCF73D
MSRSLAFLLAVTLAGTAGSQEASRDSSSAVTPERISYVGTGNGWSGGRTEWSIDRSGRGSYRTTVRIEAEGQFNAGPEGFARIRAILQPLEGLRELPCDGAVTDQGTGALSWQRGDRTSSLRFDFGCNFRQPDAARTWLGRASDLVREWALAKGPRG